jgi:hypothetical protein
VSRRGRGRREGRTADTGDKSSMINNFIRTRDSRCTSRVRAQACASTSRVRAEACASTSRVRAESPVFTKVDSQSLVKCLVSKGLNNLGSCFARRMAFVDPLYL